MDAPQTTMDQWNHHGIIGTTMESMEPSWNQWKHHGNKKGTTLESMQHLFLLLFIMYVFDLRLAVSISEHPSFQAKKMGQECTITA